VNLKNIKMENFNLRKFLVENKITSNSKILKEEEGMDFSTGNTILAVINHLIDNDRQDVLDVLQEIPQWNELVDQATDM